MNTDQTRVIYRHNRGSASRLFLDPLKQAAYLLLEESLFSILGRTWIALTHINLIIVLHFGASQRLVSSGTDAAIVRQIQ